MRRAIALTVLVMALAYHFHPAIMACNEAAAKEKVLADLGQDGLIRVIPGSKRPGLEPDHFQVDALVRISSMESASVLDPAPTPTTEEAGCTVQVRRARYR